MVDQAKQKESQQPKVDLQQGRGQTHKLERNHCNLVAQPRSQCLTWLTQLAFAPAYAKKVSCTTERHVRLFKNGRNQAVRIPREFELPGEEAIMRKEGERLVIEPAPPRAVGSSGDAGTD